MLKYLILFLSITGSISAMERESGTTTLPKTKFPQDKSWRDATLFDCITNPWIPTGLFATAVTKETYNAYRNNSLPTFELIKNEIKAQPKFLLATSLILFSCMLYVYYKPLVVSCYTAVKGRFYDQKKTCA